jgi:hypothetical protein
LHNFVKESNPKSTIAKMNFPQSRCTSNQVAHKSMPVKVVVQNALLQKADSNKENVYSNNSKKETPMRSILGQMEEDEDRVLNDLTMTQSFISSSRDSFSPLA